MKRFHKTWVRDRRPGGTLGIALLAVSQILFLQPIRAVVADVFEMEGSHVLQDEEHVGIVNGKITTGINYRDAAGISGLWAPPYVSSNFLLDTRVGGQKALTTRWTWHPSQVERFGNAGPVAVSSRTTLIHGHRAAVLQFTFRNPGRNAVPLDLFTLGWLDTVQEWGFARPGSRTETVTQVDGRQLTLRQGKTAVVLGIDSPDWSWSTSGNLGHAVAELPAGQTRSVHVVLAIGPEDEAKTAVSGILTNPARAVSGAQDEYHRQVRELFDRLPTLESDNPQLVRWYQRSLVHFLMNRWEVPEFVLQPYYSTGSVMGGCVANYLWNFGEAWEILPLYDAPAARSHIRQFLKGDLLKHFLFDPVTGAAAGPWYPINQEKIVGLIYHYVLLTGDTRLLGEIVDGKTIREHLLIQAMFGDDPAKGPVLIDYGPSNSHLELRRAYPYNHVMPDLNARRYATYLRAADLCDLAGEPAPFLRERARQLKPLLKEQLWDASARWFRFRDDKSRNELRYTVQMFKFIGSGVLDDECQAGLLSHLNNDEFLSDYGLHSLSKLDPAYDQLDIDNGGGGICTSFPPQIIERLYQAGQPKLAANILGRLLWWGDAMPYWGDSIVANCKDYRRDTPLQCTFDGVAGAQCIIFGLFGVRVQPGGDLVINPNVLPFARHVGLKGLKIRGRTIDVSIEGGSYRVQAMGRTFRSAIGTATVLAAAGN